MRPYVRLFAWILVLGAALVGACIQPQPLPPGAANAGEPDGRSPGAGGAANDESASPPAASGAVDASAAGSISDAGASMPKVDSGGRSDPDGGDAAGDASVDARAD